MPAGLEELSGPLYALIEFLEIDEVWFIKTSRSIPEGRSARFSIVDCLESRNERCPVRAKSEPGTPLPLTRQTKGPTGILDRLRTSPTLRPRNDGAVRPIEKTSESGFLVSGSRRVDPRACPSLVPGESGPRGSSVHTRPSNASNAAH